MVVALSPLKFSLVISVFAHGLVIGGAAWLGQFQHTRSTVVVGPPTTLELVAAPAAAKVPAEKTITAPVSHPPVQPIPVVPPPEPIVPPPPSEPSPAPDPVIPAPVAPIESAPVTSLPPLAGAAPPLEANNQLPRSGDNSSAVVGKDFTSASGRLTISAQPDYRKNPDPEYPLAARRRGQQGTVVVSVTVNPVGRAIAVALKESSGFELLDQAALRAVAAYEFEPARVGGRAVESQIEVPVRFQLNR